MNRVDLFLVLSYIFLLLQWIYSLLIPAHHIEYARCLAPQLSYAATKWPDVATGVTLKELGRISLPVELDSMRNCLSPTPSLLRTFPPICLLHLQGSHTLYSAFEAYFWLEHRSFTLRWSYGFDHDSQLMAQTRYYFCLWKRLITQMLHRSCSRSTCFA